MNFRLRCAKPFAKSDFLPEGTFDREFKTSAWAVAAAIEAIPNDDTPVQVIDSAGRVVWDSSEAEFESEPWERW